MFVRRKKKENDLSNARVEAKKVARPILKKQQSVSATSVCRGGSWYFCRISQAA